MGRGLDYDRSAALWRLITDPKHATTEDILSVFFNNSQPAMQHNWQGGQAADENPVVPINRVANLFEGKRPNTPADEDDEDMGEDNSGME